MKVCYTVISSVTADARVYMQETRATALFHNRICLVQGHRQSPIDYAFPVRSMQQVHSKLHTEAARMKNARIWRVQISPQAAAAARASTIG